MEVGWEEEGRDVWKERVCGEKGRERKRKKARLNCKKKKTFFYSHFFFPLEAGKAAPGEHSWQKHQVAGSIRSSRQHQAASSKQAS